jgi:hypothetical protein
VRARADAKGPPFKPGPGSTGPNLFT